MADGTRLEDVMAKLAQLEEPALRLANMARGDDHGVNLTRLRALAKRIRSQHDLALALWSTGDTAARLLATLVCRPKAFTAAELDDMVGEIASPKLLDWFVTHAVRPGPRDGETLRAGWMDRPGLVGRAGWSLTTDRVIKTPEGLDLSALLDRIEAEMAEAPEPKQWPMNHCLAEIGIRNADLRPRAIAIGERLEVLKDYPVPRGCTSPYAPLWIEEMVRRREG